MIKRRFDAAEPELMDRPEAKPSELEAALRSLRNLNRFLGSHGLIKYFLRRWIRPRDKWRVLDLATGSGDIPRLIVDYTRRVKASVEIDAVDFQPKTIATARELSAPYPEIRWHCADALRFQPPTAYDLVLCSLALHHFSEEDAVRMLTRCAKFSRRYVLVSDLRRGALATIGVYLLTALIFRDPMTKADGRLSARRAFSFREFRSLAARAGWEGFQQRRFRFARQALWLESLPEVN